MTDDPLDITDPVEPPPIPAPPPAQVIAAPALATVAPLAALNDLRATLQPLIGPMLCDVAYLESVKRNASPRTFLEFVRFAFAADLEGRSGGGSNAQVIIQAPFPRGPLDVLPPQMRID